MKNFLRPKMVALAIFAAASLGLPSSSAPPPESEPGEGIFKFSVMLFREPVPVSAWRFDQKQYVYAEGAALNITTAMQKGDVDSWLAAWEPAQRPKLSPEDRQALLEKWQSLKGGQVYLLGRVVAGASVIIQLSIVNPQQPDQVLKFPLDHTDGQWWLIPMEATDEYMNWENSPNKKVEKVRDDIIKHYLKAVAKRH